MLPREDKAVFGIVSIRLNCKEVWRSFKLAELEKEPKWSGNNSFRLHELTDVAAW